MALLGAGSGGDEDAVMADINVTPLVDVMLVLLIIFMIATPMLHQGVEVNLPRVASDTLELSESDPLVITVRPDDVIFVLDTPVHRSQLAEKLVPMVEMRDDKTVFLLGDYTVPYGDVAEIIGLLNEAGINRVALVMDPPPRAS